MKKAALLLLMIVITFCASAQIGGINGCKASHVENGISVNNAINTEAAVVLLYENMDDVTLLEPAGWIFNNVDGSGTNTYFQGNDVIFNSLNGETDSYFAQNFNGADATGLIDQWLITPVVQCSGATRFAFWARSTGAQWKDHIYIYYSPNGSSDINDFVLLRDRTTLPGLWSQYSELVEAYGPVRFAVRYYETNGGLLGDDSDYWGIDAVKVIGSSFPVPVSIWWTLGMFSFLIVGIVTRKLFIQ